MKIKKQIKTVTNLPLLEISKIKNISKNIGSFMAYQTREFNQIKSFHNQVMRN